MDILQEGFVLDLGMVVRASSNKGCWGLRLLQGFGIGEGGYGSRVLSKLIIWVKVCSGWLTLRCSLIVTVDGYGRRAAGFVIGMGLVIVVGRRLSPWVVGLSLA